MGIFKTFINQVNGTVGEIEVNAKLNPFFFGKVDHKQINNLVIVDDNGKTHQIDHVEIRENGIFCIETKNYSGNIYGSENQDYWTQYVGKEKYKVWNPIKQNKSHIYHLSKILGDKYKISSVIVLIQNNADKIDVPYVVNLDDLMSFLAQHNNGTHLSPEEMNAVYIQLIRAANTEVTNKEHIKNARDTQENIKNNICPRCNGSLVLKNGKYGQFYGCSNYPKCNFTLKEK